MIALSLFAFGMMFVGYCVGRAHAVWIENGEWQ
jgi:hypothetical protein